MQNGNHDNDGANEATPLLGQTTTDSLLPLLSPSTTITTTSTIETACPDTNGNNNNNHETLNTNTHSHNHDTTATANGKRRTFLQRKLHRTIEHSYPNGGMDTSDGSRESTTSSSIHSHLQSFRNVSIRLLQYVAHHTGTSNDQ